MARVTTFPILIAERGLPRYLEEIRRFPMLEPREEYMLATRWREHGEAPAPAVAEHSWFVSTIVIPIFLAAMIVGGASGLALATIGSSFAFAGTPAGELGEQQALTQSQDMLNSRIAYFKAVLRLTWTQERHWPPVELALRDIARRQAADEASEGGFIQRTGERATEFVLSAAALRRLVLAAQPLVNSLDEEQKRDASMLARTMGFGSVAERFK